MGNPEKKDQNIDVEGFQPTQEEPLVSIRGSVTMVTNSSATYDEILDDFDPPPDFRAMLGIPDEQTLADAFEDEDMFVMMLTQLDIWVEMFTPDGLEVMLRIAVTATADNAEYFKENLNEFIGIIGDENIARRVLAAAGSRRA